jgi:hypothetical protein
MPHVLEMSLRAPAGGQRRRGRLDHAAQLEDPVDELGLRDAREHP